MDQNFKLASPGKQTTSGLRGDWNTHNVVRLHRINDFENYRHQGTRSCSRLDVARNTITQFEEILDRNLPFGITSEIYQEVLQGADSKRDFSKLQTYLASQKFYHPIDPIVSYEQAAELYFTCRRHCRRQGITIRGSTDCLIVQISIEHNLHLLHNDRDFTQMATVFSALKIA